MVAFELATNAAKYGALSCKDGTVHVTWRLIADELATGQTKHLVVEWQETGGPPIELPILPGYGLTVIRELIPYELKGSKCFVDFAKTGIRCCICLPSKFLVL